MLVSKELLRRSGSSDSLLSVSDDESLPGTSTPSKVNTNLPVLLLFLHLKALEKGSFLKSWLPMLSPKKLQWQSNNSLCDSGFQVNLYVYIFEVQRLKVYTGHFADP